MNFEQQHPEPRSGAVEPARPRRRIGLLILVAALGYAIDVVTKVVATARLDSAEPVRILGGAVYLHLLRNPYAAFGMDFGGTWVLTVVAVAVAVGIVWFARRLRSAGWAVGLGLILAGALGNLTDRIFRAPAPFEGHVVDFISVFGPGGEYFPVFNAADSAITVGAVLIVLLTVLGRDYDGTRTGARARSGEAVPARAQDTGPDSSSGDGAETAAGPGDTDEQGRA
ncbi:signal peptidase II [Saccharomonospora saliphila]|uniref:signal peptidase II n=1 Tax=Saccharomonospora saliphila TaxID=369829 RepID=UPI000372167B|nr:signal peptidase II [Saccharomonospora saliphila]